MSFIDDQYITMATVMGNDIPDMHDLIEDTVFYHHLQLNMSTSVSSDDYTEKV